MVTVKLMVTAKLMVTVKLNAKATKLARKGHPWFFGDDLLGSMPGHGSIVRVEDVDGHSVGLGLYSTTSRLALRLCGQWEGAEIPSAEEFFAARLESAVAKRDSLAGPKAGVRLVHGEADGLPGLIVDRYANCAVVQVSAAAIEHHLTSLIPALVEATGVDCVIARNDIPVRKHEGLAKEVRLLHGRRIESVEIDEAGLLHQVDLFGGHKTGFYLDQRPARALVRELASGLRVLDLFCYQGGFALAALQGGAKTALAVDQSEDALARASTAAERNGLQGLETRRANVFTFLRELRAEKAEFDLIVVDPPAFAKSRRELRGAMRGYRDLNRLAIRLLAPGGRMLSCSCSHHVTPPTFEDLVRQAAADLPFRLVLRQRLLAGEDHPVWVNLPESEYLKSNLYERYD